jgi:pimeloyl-ACP methyl ester carboxylesterase
MAPMAAALRHEGFLTINWKYPSRRYPVEKLADLLAELLKELDADRTHFIAHSMGGIIVRNYLSRYKPQNAGRFVMIGTPNQGAYLADKLSAFRLFQYVFGPAGTQLCSGNRGACACAGVPACEFGIIAGGLGWKYGWNPLVPGDNDGTVSVECTRLEGASDFIVVRHAHPVIQMMPKTIKLAISFLRTGKFCN